MQFQDKSNNFQNVVLKALGDKYCNCQLFFFNFGQVHSANSWENADLGDDERKKKFLKLMGASKVKFVILKTVVVTYHLNKRRKKHT